MDDKNIVKQIFGFSKRVRKEAEELEKLHGASLAAVLGGSVVIGVVLGGLFWIPAAMAGSMFGYRLVVTAFQYPSYRMEQKILGAAERRKEIQNIYQAEIPIEQKIKLGDAFIAEFYSSTDIPVKRAVLENKSGDSVKYKTA